MTKDEPATEMVEAAAKAIYDEKCFDALLIGVSRPSWDEAKKANHRLCGRAMTFARAALRAQPARSGDELPQGEASDHAELVAECASLSAYPVDVYDLVGRTITAQAAKLAEAEAGKQRAILAEREAQKERTIELIQRWIDNIDDSVAIWAFPDLYDAIREGE